MMSIQKAIATTAWEIPKEIEAKILTCIYKVEGGTTLKEAIMSTLQEFETDENPPAMSLLNPCEVVVLPDYVAVVLKKRLANGLLQAREFGALYFNQPFSIKADSEWWVYFISRNSLMFRGHRW